MRKILFWAIVIGIPALFITTDRPTQLFFDFIVGGIVPGVNISLGFLPSLLFILLIVLLIRNWSANIRQEMMSRATSIHKLSEETKEFNDRHAGTNEKNLSVIAAPENNATKA